MANTIKLKRGTSTPSTSDISSGEVAIDTSAKKLYINDSGTVKEIGGDTGGLSLDFDSSLLNIVIGDSQAGASLSGGSNTVIGYDASPSNTSSTFMTSMGYEVGKSNTGNRNTLYGAKVLNTSGTGGYNSGFGTFTMQLATGSRNSAFGYQALRNATGNDNSAFGYDSGNALTTGTGNLCVGGRDAGKQITTGIDNTILGTDAGDTGTNDLTTGSNNILIGHDAAVSSATVSNEITLGDTSITKFRVPGLNFSIKDSTATDNYVLTVDANGDAGWEAAAGGGIDSDSENNTVGGTNAGAALDGDTYRNTFFGKDTGKLVNSGDDNTAIGFEALDATTGGAKNVAVGSYALSANTSGDGHVAIGYEALLSNTYGNGNIGVGRQTLRSSVSGDYNVAVGYYPLYYNTTGSYNVAVGTWALQANTTGGYNVAIGYETLDKSTTASNNTAVGYQALTNATTGAKNSIFGNQAALGTTTGQSNVYIGYQAAYSATTAEYNVGIGRQCFEQLSTGAFNISIGYQGMDNVTTGSSNTGIGQYAGNALTTGSNNSFLGNGSEPSSATVSNEITLGNTSVTKFRVPGISLEATSTGVTTTGLKLGDSTTSADHAVIFGADSDMRLYHDGGNGVFQNDTGHLYIQNKATGAFAMYLEAQSGTWTYRPTSTTGHGIAHFNSNVGSTGALKAYVTANGVFESLSDYRLKTDVAAITNGITLVKNLKPSTFKWTHDSSTTHNGFIAHELKEVIPTCVDGEKDQMKSDNVTPHYQFYSDQELVPVLTAALQEAITKLETLETKVAALEAG